jgi:hypothetical protein
MSGFLQSFHAHEVMHDGHSSTSRRPQRQPQRIDRRLAHRHPITAPAVAIAVGLVALARWVIAKMPLMALAAVERTGLLTGTLMSAINRFDASGHNPLH